MKLASLYIAHQIKKEENPLQKESSLFQSTRTLSFHTQLALSPTILLFFSPLAEGSGPLTESP